MGGVFSKESNVNSGVIQELEQISGGSGDVMYFGSGYKQTIERKIMWGIENFHIGADSYEHTLDAKIEGGAVFSFLLRPSPGSAEDAMLSCSSKTKGKSSVNKPEKRRFSVKAIMHGPRGKETYEMPVKTFREFSEIFIKKDVLLSVLSDSGSLLLELFLTIYQEQSAIGIKKSVTPASGASVKMDDNCRKQLPDCSKMTTETCNDLMMQNNEEKKQEVEEKGQDDMKQIVDPVEDENKQSSLANTGRFSLLSKFPQHSKGTTLPNANKELVKKDSITCDRGTSVMQCLSELVRRLFCCKRSSIMKREMSFEGARLMKPEEFQELIRERKVAMNMEAEERRLRDLKKIADMYSRTGINPLELFPREIWEKILNRMKPEDRANIRNVHQIFRDLLENTLVGDTLLPLVLDYKIPLVQKYLAPRIQYWFQASSGRPDMKNLKTLRCVSKTLRNSVDKWLEDRILHSMRNSDESKDISSPSPVSPRDYEALNSFDLNLGEDFSKVIAWPNRFFLRSIRVDFARFLPRWDDPRREKLRHYKRRLNAQIDIVNENITEFWRKVGPQILHAYLDFSRMQFYSDATFSYELVRKCVPLMPNLKWLQLSDALLEDYEFQMEPLPSTGGQLERLDFYHEVGDDSRRLRIRELVLVANPGVKYFYSKGSIVHHTPITTYKDSLLLSLPLESADMGQEWGGGWEIHNEPPKIYINNWNLSRIALSIGKREGKHFFTNSIDFILDFLQRFQTLEEVELHLDHLTVGEKLNFLRLPNLKNFLIEFGPEVTSHDEAAFFYSLQFLLRCGNLRALVWEDLRRENAPQLTQCTLEPLDGMLLDFKSGREDLSESIIWDVFPRLSSVKVKFVEVDAEDIYAGRSVQRLYRERLLISEDECACKWEPPVESSSDSDA